MIIEYSIIERDSSFNQFQPYVILQGSDKNKKVKVAFFCVKVKLKLTDVVV